MAKVHRGAFLGALILAPLVLAIPAGVALAVLIGLDLAVREIGIVLLAITFAAVLGAPTYLTFGAVTFWVGLRRRLPIWAVALAANVISAPVVLAVILPFELHVAEAVSQTLFLIGFGCVFAPIWGLIFEALYDWFRPAGDASRDHEGVE